MMSREGRGLAKFWHKEGRLREIGTDKRGRGKKSQIFSWCHLWMGTAARVLEHSFAVCPWAWERRLKTCVSKFYMLLSWMHDWDLRLDVWKLSKGKIKNHDDEANFKTGSIQSVTKPSFGRHVGSTANVQAVPTTPNFGWKYSFVGMISLWISDSLLKVTFLSSQEDAAKWLIWSHLTKPTRELSVTRLVG